MSHRATPSSHRIQIIDIVRGVAVLGIFAVNIQEMALPEALAFQFHSDDQGESFDNFLGIALEILFYGKMRGLFSMLFGLSSMLILEKLIDRKNGFIHARFYFRRLLWLAVFGLVDSYIFLWWGDILFKYALIGTLLFAVRLTSTKALVAAALACLIALTAQPLVKYSEIVALQQKMDDIRSKERLGQRLSAEDEKLEDQWQEIQGDLRPDRRLIDQEVQIKTGSYLTLFNYNAQQALEEQTVIFYREDFLDIFLYMLLGVILFRMRFFCDYYAQQSFHWASAVFGLSIGLFVHSWLAYGIYAGGLDPVNAQYYQIFVESGRLPFVFGYLSLILIVFRTELSRSVGDCLAAVGKMALSNYFLHSIFGAFIFYGIGLGQFNQLTRSEIAMIIVLVWIFQIAFSLMWMGRFHYGPLEWLWRSLTYWKIQPLRKV
jgi:uncharacterized protein